MARAAPALLLALAACLALPGSAAAIHHPEHVPMPPVGPLVDGFQQAFGPVVAFAAEQAGKVAGSGQAVVGAAQGFADDALEAAGEVSPPECLCEPPGWPTWCLGAVASQNEPRVLAAVASGEAARAADAAERLGARPDWATAFGLLERAAQEFPVTFNYVLWSELPRTQDPFGMVAGYAGATGDLGACALDV